MSGLLSELPEDRRTAWLGSEHRPVPLDRLGPSGRYRVTTQSGAQYFIELQRDQAALLVRGPSERATDLEADSLVLAVEAL